MRGLAGAAPLVWTATAAVHGLAVWLLALNLETRAVYADPPAMSVELAEVMGGEVAPRIAAPPPARTRSEVPEDPPLDPPIARWVDVEPPSPRPRSETAAAPPTPAAAAPAPPAAAEVATPAAPAAERQGVAHGLDVKAPNGAGRDYGAKLRSWLEAHKTYPRRARMRREEGVVEVRFVIDRKGHVLDGAILRTSGHPSLDAEVLAMLARADPFPPAPQQLAGDRIEVAAPVEFFLSN